MGVLIEEAPSQRITDGIQKIDFGELLEEFVMEDETSPAI
jgi:hypothetical protein